MDKMPDSITIVACNFWRTNSKRILLKYLSLDDKSIACLIDDLRNPRVFQLKNVATWPRLGLSYLNTPFLHVLTPSVDYHLRIKILSHRFIFK
jgi:hypothetical protein